MRNDGLLYTGLTSQAQLQRLEATKKEKKRQKANQKAKILPSAELLIELLAKEKKATILKLLETVQVDTSEEQTKSLILALNLYKDSLSGLEAQIKAIMRAKWQTT